MYQVPRRLENAGMNARVLVVGGLAGPPYWAGRPLPQAFRTSRIRTSLRRNRHTRYTPAIKKNIQKTFKNIQKHSKIHENTCKIHGKHGKIHVKYVKIHAKHGKIHGKYVKIHEKHVKIH